jgi:hypothetical protein
MSKKEKLRENPVRLPFLSVVSETALSLRAPMELIFDENEYRLREDGVSRSLKIWWPKEPSAPKKEGRATSDPAFYSGNKIGKTLIYGSEAIHMPPYCFALCIWSCGIPHKLDVGSIGYEFDLPAVGIQFTIIIHIGVWLMIVVRSDAKIS